MKLARIVTILVFLGIFACVGVYALRYMPFLVVKEVVVRESEGMALPSSVKGATSLLQGKPLFGQTKSDLDQALTQEPLVESFRIRRKIPNTFVVTIDLRNLDAILLVMEDGQVESALAVVGSDMFGMQVDDTSIYPQSVVRMVISPQYGDVLTQYGVDNPLLCAIRQLQSLKDMSLITMVKYDNNSSDRLGRVVLQLASLHAEICVREEITPELMNKAVDVVVREERGRLHLHNEWTRYDVYATGIVRR